MKFPVSKPHILLLMAATLCAATGATGAADKPVGITPTMMDAFVIHDADAVKIMRDQNNAAVVIPAFAKTSRPCPPFCIQPIKLAPGVETLGEREIIDYLVRMSKGDSSIMVIDSRTPGWVEKGTIPGAVNIPWTALNPAKGADPISIGEIMEDQFGVTSLEGLWDYSRAKTLVLFCNGMWCGQSPNNIANLLKFGYPADKIKWYRGGMQNWSNLGLTSVKPAS
jgi:rhodanese-related sulfurtransferase